MKHIKIDKILMVTAVSAFVLFASGCNKEMTHHDAMSHEMSKTVEQASSQSDHERIAASYEKEAAMLLKKAEKHEKLAATYKETDYPKPILGGDAAKHCRSIAKKYRSAAADHSALAKLHRQQAAQIAQ